MWNDYLIVPLFVRDLGSNYFTTDRVLNLWFLIMSVLLVSMVMTACHSDITPEYCTENVMSGYSGTSTFCMHQSEIPVSWTWIFILCGVHYMIRLLFQRVQPNKLQMDLQAQLSLYAESVNYHQFVIELRYKQCGERNEAVW